MIGSSYVQEDWGVTEWPTSALVLFNGIFFGEFDLIDSVLGEWVGRGEQRGLDLVAFFVGDVAELSDSAVRECEPVRRKMLR